MERRDQEPQINAHEDRIPPERADNDTQQAEQSTGETRKESSEERFLRIREAMVKYPDDWHNIGSNERPQWYRPSTRESAAPTIYTVEYPPEGGRIIHIKARVRFPGSSRRRPPHRSPRRYY